MKQLSNPLNPNSLLNKEIGETTMSKTKNYKYTVREVLIKYFSNEGWTKSGHELLKLNLQETKEVKWKPKQNERYYFINDLGRCDWASWWNTVGISDEVIKSHKFRLQIGNCFPYTKEGKKQAEEYREKLLSKNY